MLKNTLAYTILWFLLFRSVAEINCQTVPFKPKGRDWHTATLIDNKLYILGGSPSKSVGKVFFYLDVSVPFNTHKLSRCSAHDWFISLHNNLNKACVHNDENM